uniref:Uncharacterized protein n=1 Tax=Erythrolobus australicus TaxID=1077150 RepID=A0A7S1XJQ5_9RHOD|mmetsp:Transcript_502/g.1292  ORF Transcript_502/g.1292 Transcript_502/m.1292 type:complete len:133 (+) Transcript_502:255-653(+)
MQSYNKADSNLTKSTPRVNRISKAAQSRMPSNRFPVNSAKSVRKFQSLRNLSDIGPSNDPNGSCLSRSPNSLSMHVASTNVSKNKLVLLDEAELVTLDQRLHWSAFVASSSKHSQLIKLEPIPEEDSELSFR